MGAWCRADLEVPGRERQCPIRVGTGLQPELRRVIGEGLGMPREEFVVPGCRLGAPLAGLRDTAGLAQDTGKLCRVIEVVRGDGGHETYDNVGVDLAYLAERGRITRVRRGIHASASG